MSRNPKVSKAVKKKKSKYETKEEYESREKPAKPIDLTTAAFVAPAVIKHFQTSMVQQAQSKINWKYYKLEIRDGELWIIRELCDRCGEKLIPKQWRKVRVYHHGEYGDVRLESGICKDCINASVYVDKYLDGEVLTEVEAKKMFYKYSIEYERAWRMVIASAPRIAITDQEWQHTCRFFGGCAMCGGPIQVQAKFFPRRFNGEHTAWNVIPLCEDCYTKHYRGRLDISKPSRHYKVFSTHKQFQKMKTIRMYLLTKMEEHDLWMEPLLQWRKRFFETKTLDGSRNPAFEIKEDEDGRDCDTSDR